MQPSVPVEILFVPWWYQTMDAMDIFIRVSSLIANFVTAHVVLGEIELKLRCDAFLKQIVQEMHN